MKLAIAATLAVSIVFAQQAPRGAGQNTREFLGLGPPPDAAAAERGSKIYTANCSFCHGLKATGGDSGPDLIRSTVVLHDQKGETIGPLVRNGRPDRGMPAFPSFSDAQLYEIAEFLHMRVELAANRGTYHIANILTGDATAGKAFFNGAGECYRCHSVTGDLAHVGAKYSPVDLQQTFLYPAARGQSKNPPKVIVRLASGETISGTVLYLDDFVAVIGNSDGTFRTVTRNPTVKVQVEDPLAVHRDLLDRYTDRDMHNLTAYLATLK
jgi:mono/diheme cytochrome c family protein